jgi:PAS domain-containing protein
MRDVDPLDLVETIREAILVLEPDLTIRFANRSFYDTFAVAPGQTVGRKLHEIGNGQWDIPELRAALESVILGQNGRNTVETFQVEHFSRQSANAQWRSTHAGFIGLAARENGSSLRSKTSLSEQDSSVRMQSRTSVSACCWTS